MRLINTKAHAVYDYLMGVLLITSPFIFHYTQGGVAEKISTGTGICIILMSVFTNYEYGLAKSLRLNFHLSIDVLIGIFLAASPWVFHFGQSVFKPHLVF